MDAIIPGRGGGEGERECKIESIQTKISIRYSCRFCLLINGLLILELIEGVPDITRYKHSVTYQALSPLALC